MGADGIRARRGDVKTFRGIVREALEALEPRTTAAGITPYDADDLAQLIEYGLRAEGIRLHDSEKCIRLSPAINDLGRPITAGELKAHGLSPAVYGFSEGE